jgi:hypothetical protein
VTTFSGYVITSLACLSKADALNSPRLAFVNPSHRLPCKSFPSFLYLLQPLSSSPLSIYQPHQQVIFGGNNSHNTATSTTTGTAAYTGFAVYGTTILQPPPPPNPPIPLNQFVQLSSGSVNGLSIPHTDAFFRFSIEMSVVSHVCTYTVSRSLCLLLTDCDLVSPVGKNSSLIQVPFLNLMANIKSRAASVQVRVGGNSQESARLISSLPNGTMLVKNRSNVLNPTDTPYWNTLQIFSLSWSKYRP